MDVELRRRMGEAALKVVKAARYYNAGTVEFLVDQHRQFYFLEMNTRLQVEHPVTEMVTGMDLVKHQIRVAAGEKLGLRQEDIVMRGAAIECRIYAEDPANNFFPSPGKITALRTPSGPGIRDDGGVYEGWTVPIDYDPMISKLAAWGATRGEAIERLRRALGEYHIEGIKTNISFFLEVLDHEGFRNGDFDTGFIDRWLKTRTGEPPIPILERDFAALGAVLFHSEAAPAATDSGRKAENPWKLEGRRIGLRTR
jgi:acetyl-CoA carboxylase biotin carboxylase subunit